MRIGAVVQARMTSERLPGKVLMPLAGKPLIVWLLERLERAETLDSILVATSSEATDDPIAEFCARRPTRCFRGDLGDVAARVLAAARDARLDAFVRVNGDSPLLDQDLVDHAVRLMRAGGYDLVTNVRPRTFPPGQSVEVVRTDSLARALAEPGVSAHDREHATATMYDGVFDVRRFEADPPQIETDFSVDTPADARRIETLLRSLRRPHWEYRWHEMASGL